MSFKHPQMSQKPYICHFKCILKVSEFVPKIAQFLEFRLQFSPKPLIFIAKSPIVARRRRCQIATTASVFFTCAIALSYELWIVARRRRSQLATTVPLLRRAVNRQPGFRAP